MTHADWTAAIRPKVAGTWNLHQTFKNTGDLDFFVILSSTSGVIGLAGQSNYSAGGSYQDALARWRVSRGLPAVSLDLDAIKGVGYVAERADVTERMRKAGNMLVEEEWMLGVLESAILEPYDPQVLVGINHAPGNHWDRDAGAKIGRDNRFLALRYQESQGEQRRHGPGGGGGANTGDTLASRLAEAVSRREAACLVENAIADKLADIFMIPVGEIDAAGKPLTHYGVDSLVAVELRNMLILQAAAEVSIFNILQSPSLSALAMDVVSRSTHVERSLLQEAPAS